MGAAFDAGIVRTLGKLVLTHPKSETLVKLKKTPAGNPLAIATESTSIAPALERLQSIWQSAMLPMAAPVDRSAAVTVTIWPGSYVPPGCGPAGADNRISTCCAPACRANIAVIRTHKINLTRTRPASVDSPGAKVASITRPRIELAV